MQSIVLDLPPCCIVFHPGDSRYAVIGTYNLEKESEPDQPLEQDLSDSLAGKVPQSRNGSLVLIEVVENEMYVLTTVWPRSSLIDFE